MTLDELLADALAENGENVDCIISNTASADEMGLDESLIYGITFYAWSHKYVYFPMRYTANGRFFYIVLSAPRNPG
jgi:hypothetical protein